MTQCFPFKIYSDLKTKVLAAEKRDPAESSIFVSEREMLS